MEEGGTLVVTFKSSFANENVKVHVDAQPHILKNALGISYNQFTFPRDDQAGRKAVWRSKGIYGAFETGRRRGTCRI